MCLYIYGSKFLCIDKRKSIRYNFYDYFKNINVNVMFILKTSLNICTALVADFMCLYHSKQTFTYGYEKVDTIKILKTRDYFQNINIKVVFLFIIFLFYMLNTVKYLCLARYGY